MAADPASAMASILGRIGCHGVWARHVYGWRTGGGTLYYTSLFCRGPYRHGFSGWRLETFPPVGIPSPASGPDASLAGVDHQQANPAFATGLFPFGNWNLADFGDSGFAPG